MIAIRVSLRSLLENPTALVLVGVGRRQRDEQLLAIDRFDSAFTDASRKASASTTTISSV
jgi:hypothetical protein